MALTQPAKDLGPQPAGASPPPVGPPALATPLPAGGPERKRFARVELVPLEPARLPDDRCRERAFLSLPSHQRFALFLRDVQGLSYAEIGRALGLGMLPQPMAHRAVCRLIYNARESIRLAVLHAHEAGVPAALLMEEAH